MNVKVKKVMRNKRYEVSIFANFVVGKIMNISVNFTSNTRMIQVNFDSDYVK